MPREFADNYRGTDFQFRKQIADLLLGEGIFEREAPVFRESPVFPAVQSGRSAVESVAPQDRTSQRASANQRPLEIRIQPNNIVLREEVIGSVIDEVLVKLAEDEPSFGNFGGGDT